MTRTGIDPRSPGPLANTLSTGPISWLNLSDISAIKRHLMTKYNKDGDKFKSLDIRKILINNTKITYKNNNKNRLQILEAIPIAVEKGTFRSPLTTVANFTYYFMSEGWYVRRRERVVVVWPRSNRARPRRMPRGLFWTSVRSVALEKEQWQTWGL